MISVIIPVYQAEEYLQRCVDSVLAQTYKELEVILVDDGSTDKSPALCDAYAKQDQRVKVCHKKNEGVSVARNTGLEMVTGEYITFVDSDDYIDQEMYAKMYEIAEDHSCEVVMCDCLKEDGKTATLYTHDIRSGYYSRDNLEKEYFVHLLMMENVEYPATISNWVILFRNNRNVPRYVPKVRYSEDLLFGAELMYHADSFYYMKGEAYYHYWNANQNSATHQFKIDKWQDYLILYRAAVTFFEKEKQRFGLQLYKMLLFFVYNTLSDIRGSGLTLGEKYTLTENVLKNQAVREMFANIHVMDLPITGKLKVITLCYKYRIGIHALIRYVK